jgi:protein SPT2
LLAKADKNANNAQKVLAEKKQHLKEKDEQKKAAERARLAAAALEMIRRKKAETANLTKPKPKPPPQTNPNPNPQTAPTPKTNNVNKSNGEYKTNPKNSSTQPVKSNHHKQNSHVGTSSKSSSHHPQQSQKNVPKPKPNLDLKLKSNQKILNQPTVMVVAAVAAAAKVNTVEKPKLYYEEIQKLADSKKNGGLNNSQNKIPKKSNQSVSTQKSVEPVVATAAAAAGVVAPISSNIKSARVVAAKATFKKPQTPVQPLQHQKLEKKVPVNVQKTAAQKSSIPQASTSSSSSQSGLSKLTPEQILKLKQRNQQARPGQLSSFDKIVADVKKKKPLSSSSSTTTQNKQSKKNESDEDGDADDYDDDDDDEYDSEMDDFIADDDDDDLDNSNEQHKKYTNEYSKHIRQMFKYNPERYKDENIDDIDDMDTDFTSLMREERMSAKIAQLEEEREDRLEAEREARRKEREMAAKKRPSNSNDKQIELKKFKKA